jgi:hypothetical protein
MTESANEGFSSLDSPGVAFGVDIGSALHEQFGHGVMVKLPELFVQGELVLLEVVAHLSTEKAFAAFVLEINSHYCGQFLSGSQVLLAGGGILGTRSRSVRVDSTLLNTGVSCERGCAKALWEVLARQHRRN